MAKEITEALHEYTNSDLIFKNVLIHQQNVLQQTRPTTLYLSNLDPIDLLQNDNGFIIKEMISNISFPLTAPHVVCYTHDGCIEFNYMYTKPWLDTETIEILASEVHALLKQLVINQ